MGSLADQITAIGDPVPSAVYFNSGASAPQYIELELPCLCTVHNIFLQTAQEPNGNTKHQLFAGPTSNPTQLVHTLVGYTTSLQWIHINFSPPLTDVRFLRLVTTSSPSWVGRVDLMYCFNNIIYLRRFSGIRVRYEISSK